MKDSKQMELIPSISLQEDTLASLSPSQVEKKVKKIQDTSGQSILDLSKSVGQLGLLEKMLVDTLNSVSTPLSRTWRVKTTPLGRLVFQLRASAPTTKEKESGLWPTPTAMTGGQGVAPSHKKGKHGWNTGAAVQDSLLKNPIRMWPTPNASDNRDRGNLSDPAVQRRIAMGKQVGLTMAVKEQKGGGSLNPTWVEWLMGYPKGWTDLNH